MCEGSAVGAGSLQERKSVFRFIRRFSNRLTVVRSFSLSVRLLLLATSPTPFTLRAGSGYRHSQFTVAPQQYRTAGTARR